MTSIRGDGSVEFRFFRPEAQQVAIAGEFNNWETNSLPMRAQGDGWWYATAQLGAGEYRFRYVADGSNWHTDYAANGVEFSKFGWNSVLVVSKAVARMKKKVKSALKTAA
jgi:1,4-alpha-glucan branching enzyme